jgi:cobalt-zinc-cadmium efflux system protein
LDVDLSAAQPVHEQRRSPGRALAIGLGLTLTFAFVEVGAGVLSGSLALVADAGHMLVDSAGLVLALVATLIAKRPRDLRRTYGYARVEVLVVPVHVMLMLMIAGYIVYEAIGRIGSEPEIHGVPVLVVGFIGLGINILTFGLLHGHSHDNLNARGAMFEVLADMLGSVGVIVAAGVLLVTGWSGVDVIVSLIIGALVVPRALALLRQALTILLEGTPAGVKPERIAADVEQVKGVRAVHDLHVWALAPSFIALSAHVEVERMEGCDAILTEVTRVLKERHNISHITLQPETQELHEAIDCCLYPDFLPDAAHHHAPAGSSG